MFYSFLFFFFFFSPYNLLVVSDDQATASMDLWTVNWLSTNTNFISNSCLILAALQSLTNFIDWYSLIDCFSDLWSSLIYYPREYYLKFSLTESQGHRDGWNVTSDFFSSSLSMSSSCPLTSDKKSIFCASLASFSDIDSWLVMREDNHI